MIPFANPDSAFKNASDLLEAHKLIKSECNKIQICVADLNALVRLIKSQSDEIDELKAVNRAHRRALDEDLIVENVESLKGSYKDLKGEHKNNLHISLGIFDVDDVPEIVAILEAKLTDGLKAINPEAWPNNSGVSNKGNLLNYSVIEVDDSQVRINILIKIFHKMKDGFMIVPKLDGELKSTLLNPAQHLTYTDLVIGLFKEETNNE